jgi:hypothetical protein
MKQKVATGMGAVLGHFRNLEICCNRGSKLAQLEKTGCSHFILYMKNTLELRLGVNWRIQDDGSDMISHMT